VSGDGLNLIRVSDAADERIRDYANLKDRELEARRSAFIAEGELVVRRLIGSDFPVRSVLLAEDWLGAMRDALEHLAPGTPVHVGTSSLVSAIVGFPMHRGVLAAGERRAPRSAGDLAKSCSTLVVLEDMANHDNLGGVFRNAAALGGPAPGVLLSPGCCDPLYRKSIRVSMGWALRVPFARLAPWPAGLNMLSSAGFTTVAMTPAGDAVELEDLSGRVERPAIVLGTEGPGLSEDAMRTADVRCRIAMGGSVDSLNVVVAAAIALHRLVRKPVS